MGVQQRSNFGSWIIPTFGLGATTAASAVPEDQSKPSLAMKTRRVPSSTFVRRRNIGTPSLRCA